MRRLFFLVYNPVTWEMSIAQGLKLNPSERFEGQISNYKLTLKNRNMAVHTPRGF